jgi:hypothetical protein
MPADDANNAAARAEAITRIEGRWLRAGGAISAVFIAFVAYAYRLNEGQPFPYEITMTLLLASAVAFATGMWERAHRSTREALNIALSNQHLALAAQAANAARLDRIERTFAGLAAVLPDEIDKRWWTGFGAAATEGLLDTGTEGRTRIPGHVSGDVLKFRRN